MRLYKKSYLMSRCGKEKKVFSYKKFEKLCKERKVSPYQVAKGTGIATATLSSWKKHENGEGGYVPKMDKIILIADFFDVSADYFAAPLKKHLNKTK